MDTAAAARTLRPIFEDPRFSVELVVLATRVAGRGPLRLLAHWLRVSGTRYVAWQLRRGLKGRFATRREPSLRRLLAARPELKVLRSTSLRESGAAEEIRRCDADLGLCAIFPEKLTPEQYSLPRLGTLNVHGSLLPRHRGVTPVLHALAEGAQRHGASVYRLDERFDTGPLLTAEAFSLEGVTDYQEAWERTMDASARALRRALDLVAEDPTGLEARCVPQTGPSSYCSWPSRATLRRARERGIRLN